MQSVNARETRPSPIIVGITGATGLLGRHARALLQFDPRFEVREATRSTFASLDTLKDFSSSCAAIIHLAGMNRGPDDEIANTNLTLTRRLVEACQAGRHQPHIIFASSIHVNRPTAYGLSKRHCTEVLAEWASKSEAPFTNLILPHVFGEGGRPFYNSAVATFCHQIARGQTPEIHADGEVELLHAQAFAAIARDAILSGKHSELRPQGQRIRVGELAKVLAELCESYLSGIIPDLSKGSLILHLFNALRHEIYQVRPVVTMPLHTDPRGSLFETVKTRQGGQSFLSSTKPGITRGNHFHYHKFERFIVIEGEGLIKVRPLFQGEATEYRLSGTCPQYVDIPTLHTHSITNVGTGQLLTQFWSHEIFDPNAPDTVPETV